MSWQLPGRRTSPSVVVAVLAGVGVMSGLQGTIIFPLTADIPEIYDVGAVAGSWIVTASYLAGAVATPLLGRMADMYGKRRIMLSALGALVVGSLMLALSDNFFVGVSGRLLQGIASALVPVGISVMKDVLPAHRVGSGIALMAGTMGIGSAVGMPVAGLLYGQFGWASLFWMVAIAGVVLAVACQSVIPDDPPRPAERFDLVGALLLVLGLTPFLIVITQGNDWGWGSPAILLLGVTAAVLFAAFVPWERRAADPLVDLGTFVLPPVVLTNVASMAIGVGMLLNLLIAGQQLAVPTSVPGGLGLSATTAGLLLAIPASVLTFTAPLVGSLLARYGGRVVLMAAGATYFVGFQMRVFLDDTAFQVILGSVIICVGTSLGLSSIPVIIMNAVPLHQTAAANGISALFRSIGTSVATAGLGAIVAVTAVTSGGLEFPTTSTYHVAFWICAVLGLVGSALAWFVHEVRDVAGPSTGEVLAATAGTPEDVSS